ncbi:MAG TPA: hypothetical protein VH186_10420 [Chloroflexia bacterium]|nr:hypothetical protein [Chloroflexia bacterium]
MSENTWNQNLGWNEAPTESLINQIHEGMEVVDAQNNKVGKVEFVKMGNPDAATTKGNEVRPTGLVESVLGSVMGGEPDVPEPLRSRLLRYGFIKVDDPGLLDQDRYFSGDQIQTISGDTVRLKVSKNKLPQE